MRQARVLRRGSIIFPACRAHACRATPDAQKLSISFFRGDNRHQNTKGLFPLLAEMRSGVTSALFTMGEKRTLGGVKPFSGIAGRFALCLPSGPSGVIACQSSFA